MFCEKKCTQKKKLIRGSAISIDLSSGVCDLQKVKNRCTSINTLTTL
jgi:hypothetical protein